MIYFIYTKTFTIFTMKEEEWRDTLDKGLNVSPMKNKKMSEKHKEKISIANKGKIKSLEWMENIAKAKAEKIVKWFEHTWYFSSIEEANAFKKYWNI